MLYILGVIPYIVLSLVLSTLGVGLSHWQFYAIFVCMVVSDTINFFKGQK